MVHISKKAFVETHGHLEAGIEVAKARSVKQQQYYVNDHVNQSVAGSTEAEKKEIAQELKKALSKAALRQANDVWGKDMNSDECESIISLMAKAMNIQAKANSDYWKNLWDQGSKNMDMQLKFAPLIAQATKSAYDEQKQATLEEAGKEHETCIIMGVAAGATLAHGWYNAIKTPKDKEETLGISKDLETDVADAEKKLEAAETKVAAAQEKVDSIDANTPNEEAIKRRGDLAMAKKERDIASSYKDACVAVRDADQISNEAPKANATAEEEKVFAAKKAEAEKAAGKAKDDFIALAKREGVEDNIPKAWKTWGRFKNAAGKVGNVLTKGMVESLELSRLHQMWAQSAQAGVAGNHDGHKAIHQGNEGGYQATVKMSESLTQFFHQLFQRHEELRGNTQQLIDYAMNILKSSVDTITQTQISLFRN